MDLQLNPFDKELLAELYFLIGKTSRPCTRMHWWQEFTTESSELTLKWLLTTYCFSPS